MAPDIGFLGRQGCQVYRRSPLAPGAVDVHLVAVPGQRAEGGHVGSCRLRFLGNVGFMSPPFEHPDLQIGVSNLTDILPGIRWC